MLNLPGHQLVLRFLCACIALMALPNTSLFAQEVPEDTISSEPSIETEEVADDRSIEPTAFPEQSDDPSPSYPPTEEELDKGEFPPITASYHEQDAKNSREYGYDDLKSTTDWAAVSAADKRIDLLPDPAESRCALFRMRRVRVRVHLYAGTEDYKFGETDFTYSVSGTVTEHKADGSTAGTYSSSFNLLLEKLKPEHVWQSQWITIPAGNEDHYFTIDIPAAANGPNILSTPVGGTAAVQALLNPELALVFSLEEEYRSRTTDVNGDPVDIIELDPVDANPSGIDPVVSNPVDFYWDHSTACEFDAFPEYEVQILRLYNRETSINGNPVNVDDVSTNELNVEETVDWEKAMSLLTGNPEREVTLTVAEGRGYYIWRVRPIGDFYGGGSGNSRNWGKWSSFVPDGAKIRFQESGGSISAEINAGSGWVTMTGALLNSVFFYGGFEDDKNWIYARSFTEGKEGTTISEKISFASPALHSRQSQKHQQSEGFSVVSEMLYDYVGRPAITTLLAPVANDGGGAEWTGFEYRSDFVDYEASKFDADENFDDPDQMGGTLNHYYSTSSSTHPLGDPFIPSAEGFPFSRTLFYQDADSRKREVSAPGKYHRIGGPAPTVDDHTQKTLFGEASETVLLALFGDEAPATESVRAIYSISPNKVTSVKYQSKMGELLASFLVRHTENSYLDVDLGEMEAVIGDGTNEWIEYYSTTPNPTSTGDLVYFKKLSIESPSTAVDLYYEIEPNSIDLCALGCKTCTYMLDITVYRDDDFSTPIYQMYAPGTDPVPPGQDARIDLTTFDACGAPMDPPDPPFVISSDPADSPDAPLPNFPNTLDQGDYYVLVRLITENDAPSPNEDRSFAEVWEEDEIRGALTTQIETEFWAVVRQYLKNNGSGVNLDGLYAALADPGAINWTDVAVTPNYEEAGNSNTPVISYTVSSSSDPSCWTITIPVYSCDVSDYSFVQDQNGVYQVGPVGDPSSFERMLYRRWGDEDLVGSSMTWGTYDPDNSNAAVNDGLNSYFRSGNTGLYDQLAQNEGIGQFDKMIEHMLNEKTVNSQPVYDPQVLLAVWQSLVRNFGYAATTDYSGDPAKYDPNYNLIEEFLSRVGKIYQGKSSIWNGSTGYLEHAYKYFKDTDPNGFADDCRDYIEGIEYASGVTYGAQSGWGPDPLDGELVDTDDDASNDKKWEMFYNCLMRDEPTKDDVEKFLGEFCADDYDPNDGKLSIDCALEMANKAEDACRERCALMEDGFRRKVIHAYHDAGYVIENETHTPQGVPIDWVNSPPTLWVSEMEVECKVALLIANCEGDCDVSIVYWDENDPTQGIKRVGTDAEVAKIQKIYSWYPKVGIPNGGACTDTEMELLTSSGNDLQRARAKAMVAAMNTRLEEYVAGLTGTESASDNCSYIYNNIFYDLAPNSYFSSHCYFCEESYEEPSAAPLKWSAPTTLSSTEVECCPQPEPWTELFTFGDNISGEFFLDGGGEAGSEKLVLMYRRTCVLDGKTYVTEQELCDDIGFNDICSTSVCFKWSEDHGVPSEEIIELSGASCEEQIARQLLQDLEGQVADLIDEAAAEFQAEYRAACLDPDAINATLRIRKKVEYYHFTLYSYDRAGRLVRTTPPLGVQPLAYGARDRATEPAHTHVTSYVYNALSQTTQSSSPDGGTVDYWYDDAGRIRFQMNEKQDGNGRVTYKRYDRLSREIETGECDAMDLELNVDDASFPDHTLHNATERTFTFYTRSYAPSLSDEPYFLLDRNGSYLKGDWQEFTLNRIAHTMSEVRVPDPDDELERSEWVHTQFSYSPHGHIEWLRQEIPGLGATYVRYDYDLLGERITGVAYNEGWADEFYHEYYYDSDGRLIEARSSRDSVIWESDSRYQYYTNGQLKRIEYGEDRVQGVDYTFTITGWLKALNNPEMRIDRSWDPGGDGDLSDVAADVFGMILGYHNGDFIGHPAFDSENPGSYSLHVDHLNGEGLYNGNISTWATHIQRAHGINGVNAPNLLYEDLVAYQYEYDVLDRIRSAQFNIRDWGNNQYVQTSEFGTEYEYDPNGNLLTLTRNGHNNAPNILMDQLTYTYQPGTNRLTHVRDLLSPGTSVGEAWYANDINDAVSVEGSAGGATPQGQEPFDRFVYDEIGNLVEDKTLVPVTGGPGVDIQWGIDGKVVSVAKPDGTLVSYTYDPAGNRVRKNVIDGSGAINKTYYVYGANNNVLATYTSTCSLNMLPWEQRDSDGDGTPNAFDHCPCLANENPNNDADVDGVPDDCDKVEGQDPPHDGSECDECSIKLDNWYVYGNAEEGRTWVVEHGMESRRGGVWGDTNLCEVPIPPFGFAPCEYFDRTLRERKLELTDHLGNVRAVVTELKLIGNPDDPVDPLLNAIAGGPPYMADMAAYNNFYPFGSFQPDRYWSASWYRYGFNGKENDREVRENEGAGDDGEGTHYDYGYRIYDPRLCRFLSIDPEYHKFPNVSPYVYVEDSPINLIDKDGREPSKSGKTGKSQVFHLLRKAEVKTFRDLTDYWGGPQAMSKGDNGHRYLYSKRWGWIDMQHFAASAFYTSKHGAKTALMGGEVTERRQQATQNPSAYDYEDLPSNLLGAYFAQEYRDKYEDLNAALFAFLTDLDVLENEGETIPEEAINYDELPDTQAEEGTGEQNRSYNPMHGENLFSRQIDYDIERFIYETRGVDLEGGRDYTQSSNQSTQDRWPRATESIPTQ